MSGQCPGFPASRCCPTEDGRRTVHSPAGGSGTRPKPTMEYRIRFFSGSEREEQCLNGPVDDFS